MGFFVLEPEEHSLHTLLWQTFYAILIGIPVMLYIFTSERKFLYAAGLLFLSSILESVRTGIGASILGLSLLFLAYKKGRAVPAVMLLIALFVGSVFFVKPVKDKMFGKQAETVTISNVGKAKIETSGREYMWKRIMNHCYNPKSHVSVVVVVVRWDG